MTIFTKIQEQQMTKGPRISQYYVYLCYYMLYARTAAWNCTFVVNLINVLFNVFLHIIVSLKQKCSLFEKCDSYHEKTINAIKWKRSAD